MKIFMVAASALLASCSTIKGQINDQLQEGVQAMIDSAKGYRIEHHSIPAGAKILCGGVEAGVAPFQRHVSLSAQQVSERILVVDDCKAVWPSGARADIQANVPLERFPKFVHLVSERPTDPVAGYAEDEEAGNQVLFFRQKQIEDIQREVSSLISLGTTFRQMAKNNQGAPTVSSTLIPTFKPVSDRGIRWNWIQSPSMPFPATFAALPSGPNRQFNWVMPATSCTGAVVMGRCAGATLPTERAYLCAGAFLNGRCTGAVLFGN